MDSEQRQKPESLVHNSARSLMRPGADALVKRGLQDLALRGARWTRKWTTPEDGLFAQEVTPLGFVAAEKGSYDDQIDSIAIYNPETGQRFIIESPMTLPEEGSLGSFVWSPCGRYLLIQILGVEPEGALWLYDAVRSEYLGMAGYLPTALGLVWSPKGNFVVSSPKVSYDHTASGFAAGAPPLTVWHVEFGQQKPLRLVKLAELDFDAWRLQFKPDIPPDELYWGSWPIVFSPNESLIAVSAWTDPRVEWRKADSSIICFDLSTLDQRLTVPMSGGGGLARSLDWTFNGKLIYCDEGRAYRLEPETGEKTEFPFPAIDCCCHPFRELCAFAHKGGRACVVNLTDLSVITEQSVGFLVWDMRWSVDGNTLYVLSVRDGSDSWKPWKYDFWTCVFPD